MQGDSEHNLLSFTVREESDSVLDGNIDAVIVTLPLDPLEKLSGELKTLENLFFRTGVGSAILISYISYYLALYFLADKPKPLFL